MLLALEWTGSIAAIIGAFIASTRVLKATYAWLLWIFTNLCFIVLFLYTSQYGLLTMHVIGLFINIFGYYQWKNHKTEINPHVAKYFFYSSVGLSILGTFCLLWFFIDFTEKPLEWFGTFFGIAGAFMLASRSKYSQLCWMFWTFSNMSLIFLCFFYTNQYGILFQQIFFMVTNVIGLTKVYIGYKRKNQSANLINT